MVSEVIARILSGSLRAERARLGWTQAQLARRLGWSQQKVGALETGARRMFADELPAVALALGVPLRDLLAGLPPQEFDALGL